MEREANSRLLNRIWQALDDIRPPGESGSLAELGCVTAASTDGEKVRVLLRLPAKVVRRGEFLARIEHAMREVPSLDDIALRVKPYWPLLPGNSAEWTRSHGVCVANAMRKLHEEGWALDGASRPGARSDSNDQPESLRVIICAHIGHRASASPVPVH